MNIFLSLVFPPNNKIFFLSKYESSYLSKPFLLDIDISDAQAALVNITSSTDLTLQEAEKIVQIVGDKLSPNANIIWGTQIDESLQNTVRTTVIVSGITPYDFSDNNSDDEESENAPSESNESEEDDPLSQFIDGVF